MKKAVQVTFELMNGGAETLDDWMWKQRSAGASFRKIADLLTQKIGIPVSHESIRQWLKVG